MHQYFCSKKLKPKMKVQESFAQNFCTKKAVRKMLVKLTRSFKGSTSNGSERDNLITVNLYVVN
jgi:hypothetical protein